MNKFFENPKMIYLIYCWKFTHRTLLVKIEIILIPPLSLSFSLLIVNCFPSMHCRLSTPNTEIQTLKCSKIQRYLSAYLIPLVGHSMPDLEWWVVVETTVQDYRAELLPGCVTKVGRKQQILCLDSNPMPKTSHYMYTSSLESVKSPQLRHVWSPAFQMRGTQPV